MIILRLQWVCGCAAGVQHPESVFGIDDYGLDTEEVDLVVGSRCNANESC